MLETWQLIANIATALTSVGLIIAVVQLIKESRVENAQSFFYLHGYLVQEEFSHARATVRTRLYKMPIEDWSKSDKEEANRVCASYDQTGIFLMMGILDRKTKKRFLQSSWGQSIIDQYEGLEQFLNQQQTPTKTGRDFFEHFTWLYHEALEARGEEPRETVETASTAS